jgi:hypothetical protein
MKNANLPFDRLMALSKVEGLRYPHSSSLRPAVACGAHFSEFQVPCILPFLISLHNGCFSAIC